MDCWLPKHLLWAAWILVASFLLGTNANTYSNFSRIEDAFITTIIYCLMTTCARNKFFELQVGTKATKYKSQLKSNLDESMADSSCRGPSQVLACSIVGVIFQLIHFVYCGDEQAIGQCAVETGRKSMEESLLLVHFQPLPIFS